MRYKELIEHATAGATMASNIAIVPGNTGKVIKRPGIGAGFDQDGDYGIYEPSKKKKVKKKKK